MSVEADGQIVVADGLEETASRIPIPRLLDLRAAEEGNRIAYRWDDCDVTFADFRRAARAVGARLRELGLGKCDRVALYLENSPEWMFAWMGSMYIGVEPVAINLAYKKEFLQHQVVDSDTRIVFTSPALLGEVVRVVRSCPKVLAVAVVGDPDDPAVDTTGVRILRFDEFSVGDLVEEDSGVELADGAMILYTSGTTGMSKGVALSHGYLARVAENQEDFLGITESDVVHVPLPLFHISGINGLLHPLRSRAVSSFQRRFSVAGCLQRMADVGATVVPMVGPMLQMFWNTPPSPVEKELKWRLIWCAPIPISYQDLNRRFGIQEVVTAYGQTEVMPASVGVIPGVPEGSAGLPMPNLEVKIVGEDGVPVPQGEPGELLLRPTAEFAVFERYLNQPVDRPGGWYRTGDICRQDQQGHLYWVDRAGDIVRRRGENIPSVLVEQGLLDHPAVREVAVHGVPSDLGESEVKAVVVIAPGGSVTEAELFEHCEQVLPGFAVPRYLEFLDSLPKNPIGRTQKFKLRERGVTPATADRLASVEKGGVTR